MKKRIVRNEPIDVKVRERYIRLAKKVERVVYEKNFGNSKMYHIIESSTSMPYNAMYLTPSKLEKAIDAFDKKMARKDVSRLTMPKSIEEFKVDSILDHIPINLKKRSRATFTAGYATAANRGAWLDHRMKQVVGRIAVVLEQDENLIADIYETCFEALVQASKTYDFATIEIPYLGYFKPRIRMLENYRIRMRYNYDNTLVTWENENVVDTSYLRRATAINLAIQRHWHEISYNKDDMPLELIEFYCNMRDHEILQDLNKDNFPTSEFDTFPAPKKKHFAGKQRNKIDKATEPIKQKELQKLRNASLKGKVVPNYKSPGKAREYGD